MFKNIYKKLRSKNIKHKKYNKNEKKKHVRLLPHMRTAAPLTPDAPVFASTQRKEQSTGGGPPHVECEPGGRCGRNRVACVRGGRAVGIERPDVALLMGWNRTISNPTQN